MSIEKKQNAIIEEFSIFDDWMDKYAYLVDLGNELTPLSPEEKTDDNLIDGCQSKLWIIVELKDGKMRFKADYYERNCQFINSCFGRRNS
jgi:cysteine desulfuration protein SufE